MSSASSPPLKPAQPFRVFISYARDDLDYLNAFKKHLSSLKSSGLLETWTDQELKPGERWEATLLKELNSVPLIVFLDSKHFAASDFINQVELPSALERQQSGTLELVRILIGPIHRTKEDPLEAFQYLPRDRRAISSLEDRLQDVAWVEVAQELESLLRELGRKGEPASEAKGEQQPSAPEPQPAPVRPEARSQSFGPWSLTGLEVFAGALLLWLLLHPASEPPSTTPDVTLSKAQAPLAPPTPTPLLKVILVEDEQDPAFAPSLAADKGKLRRHLAQELVPTLLRHGVRAVAFDFSISRATSIDAKEALEQMLTAAHALSPPVPIVALDSDEPLIDVCSTPPRSAACFDGLVSKLLVANETSTREDSEARRLDTVDICAGVQGTLGLTVSAWLRALRQSNGEPGPLPPPVMSGCSNQSVQVPEPLFALLDSPPLTSRQVLEDSTAERLRNHVVLVGMGHEDFGDRIRVSLPGGQERTVAGVLLQHIAIESILQGGR